MSKWRGYHSTYNEILAYIFVGYELNLSLEGLHFYASTVTSTLQLVILIKETWLKFAREMDF